MISCCDFTPAITVPALKQSGHPAIVSVARYDNLSSLKLIRSGAPVVLATANADTGILTSIDQILRKKAGKGSIDPNADKGAYKFAVIDKSNVPPSGQYFDDPNAQIAQFVTKWKSEFQ
jgi:hypothetical protein